ncbi:MULTISPECIES: Na(+)/H(+) antiporter subunit F1 [unclassified Exiguobacterium]|uniref:Na(+)/H(+) antiporter subunit F1 n=1 Tax=unclassified Exiguobacterium TaxID=2644629 RepID=UPI00103912B8|nr:MULTISPECIES: Na(+)/H(+) antiporter subunit F1 [unclassified Exiguobacterium]TCI69645.1 Na(+)/H(+) antiporter subunit F1 [Exiguobacterium sp. IPCI3]TCI78942.1 Na(+)/H(+) antiporter subunit F1 [Exiguobacterium sp. IPCH1]TCI81529.1 Na(+)/H(+) antiporter subunit F1 [Exiguobacterium sp. IPBC4]
MFNVLLMISLILMSFALVISFARIIKGPSLPDRIVALDSIGITLIGMIGILMILQKTIAYAEVILMIGILAFVGTIALSKFIERGNIFDRD